MISGVDVNPQIIY